MNFSVLTYNIFFNKALSNLKELVEKYKPDIICLQEIETTNSSFKEVINLGYNLADYSNSSIHNGKIFGVATFYSPVKLEFHNSSTINLPRSIYELLILLVRILKGGNKPRTVSKTSFNLKSIKRKIIIYNAHLSYVGGNNLRIKQINEALGDFEDLNSDTAVIAGDFNYYPYSRKKLEEFMKMHRFSEATKNIDYTMEYTTKHKDYWDSYNFIQKILAKIVEKLYTNKFKIDYIFFKDCKNTKTEKINVKGSDHYPMISTFFVK